MTCCPLPAVQGVLSGLYPELAPPHKHPEDSNVVIYSTPRQLETLLPVPTREARLAELRGQGGGDPWSVVPLLVVAVVICPCCGCLLMCTAVSLTVCTGVLPRSNAELD